MATGTVRTRQEVTRQCHGAVVLHADWCWHAASAHDTSHAAADASTDADVTAAAVAYYNYIQLTCRAPKFL